MALAADGARHDLLVEAPEVLEAAAAPRDDDQVGPRHGSAGDQRVEAGDGGGHLDRAGLALHPHRPDQHVAGEAVGEPMQDVADHRAGRRGHDADDARQKGQRLLAIRVEQAFGGELAFALLEQRHQRADAGGLELVDDDLIFRLVGIGGDPAPDDDFEPLLRLEFEPRRRCSARSPPRSRPSRPSA